MNPLRSGTWGSSPQEAPPLEDTGYSISVRWSSGQAGTTTKSPRMHLQCFQHAYRRGPLPLTLNAAVRQHKTATVCQWHEPTNRDRHHHGQPTSRDRIQVPHPHARPRDRHNIRLGDLVQRHPLDPDNRGTDFGLPTHDKWCRTHLDDSDGHLTDWLHRRPDRPNHHQQSRHARDQLNRSKDPVPAPRGHGTTIKGNQISEDVCQKLHNTHVQVGGWDLSYAAEQVYWLPDLTEPTLRTASIAYRAAISPVDVHPYKTILDHRRSVRAFITQLHTLDPEILTSNLAATYLTSRAPAIAHTLDTAVEDLVATWTTT